ncbi:DUF1499 domain-containing protein [Alphaproteobacteria bacterium KMM 3653]|uniref:DUF1499 domain-containing protein n=1 Tax=Harenicola maris TaxID=2841044 RepID=A0AAP2CLA1_9RHOB|nr:DUF1499 domain-containing protein [Harenicola maris]
MLYVLSVLLIMIVGFMGYVRLAPLPELRFAEMPGPFEPGVHPVQGGVKHVIPLEDLPEGAAAALREIILQTPRTAQAGQAGQAPMAFVTRSALMGFPDIALVWEQAGALHIHSHLVYGRSDMGVNSARVAAWLEALRQGAD